MPSIQIVNTTRNAALFAADKYRKAGDVIARFNDPLLPDMRTAEAEYRRIAATIGNIAAFSPSDKALCATALNAAADDLNRKAQLLADRCQTEGAGITMTQVRGVYDALAYLTSGVEQTASAEE